MFLLGIILFVACGPMYLLAGFWVGRREAPPLRSAATAAPSAEAWTASASHISNSLHEIDQISEELRQSVTAGDSVASSRLLEALATVQGQLVEATTCLQRSSDAGAAADSLDIFRQGFTELDEPATAEVRAAIDAEPEERRQSKRVPYFARQFMAVYEPGRRLECKDFEPVQCRNLSAKGIAFVSPRELPTMLVVTLGTPAARLFLQVEIVHQHQIDQDGDAAYVVGCRFLHRAVSQPDAWVEPGCLPKAEAEPGVN